MSYCDISHTRRYARAGTSYCPVSVCLSVSLSVCVRLSQLTSRCSIEIAGRIELIFGMEASFDLSSTMFKESYVSTKIRALPHGTLS